MSRETHARFLRKKEEEAAKVRNTVVAKCCGCGVGFLPKALAMGSAARIGPSTYICNECEGGGKGDD